MRSTKFILIISAILCLTNISCKKYLDAKSNQSLSTPETLDDLQALADNFLLNNTIRMSNNMADEFYIDYSLWSTGLDKHDEDSYIWDPNLNAFIEWKETYQRVFHHNTILDNLKKVDPSTDQEKWNSIKGTSLFFRAYFHENIAQLYAPQYDKNTSLTDLGIPLRLSSDFNIPSKRASVQETFDQILKDLMEATSLLPTTLPSNRLYKNRPTRTACYAMLAKVYLEMGNYEKSFEFSNQCINTYNYVLDFNASSVNPVSLNPFPSYDNNEEVVLYLTSNGPINSYDISYVDTTLYQTFDDNDLRKQVYFEETSDENGNTAHYYKGPYTGATSELFNGIAMDEVYLIRSESSARLGNAQAAMDDLNHLLSRRWKSATYTPYSGLTAGQILPVILKERKKELINRGTRWTDIRRLNKDASFAVTLKRKLNNQEYSLPPNDKRYTLLIPSEVLIKTSLEQNPR